MFQYLLPVFSAFCRASDAMFGVCLDAFLTAITLALAISNEAYDNTQTHAHTLTLTRRPRKRDRETGVEPRQPQNQNQNENEKQQRNATSFFIARL